MANIYLYMVYKIVIGLLKIHQRFIMFRKTNITDTYINTHKLHI